MKHQRKQNKGFFLAPILIGVVVGSAVLAASLSLAIRSQEIGASGLAMAALKTSSLSTLEAVSPLFVQELEGAVRSGSFSGFEITDVDLEFDSPVGTAGSATGSVLGAVVSSLGGLTNPTFATPPITPLPSVGEDDSFAGLAGNSVGAYLAAVESGIYRIFALRNAPASAFSTINSLGAESGDFASGSSFGGRVSEQNGAVVFNQSATSISDFASMLGAASVTISVSGNYLSVSPPAAKGYFQGFEPSDYDPVLGRYAGDIWATQGSGAFVVITPPADANWNIVSPDGILPVIEGASNSAFRLFADELYIYGDLSSPANKPTLICAPRVIAGGASGDDIVWENVIVICGGETPSRAIERDGIGQLDLQGTIWLFEQRSGSFEDGWIRMVPPHVDSFEGFVWNVPAVVNVTMRNTRAVLSAD